jgi:hypothetical protein
VVAEERRTAIDCFDGFVCLAGRKKSQTFSHPCAGIGWLHRKGCLKEFKRLFRSLFPRALEIRRPRGPCPLVRARSPCSRTRPSRSASIANVASARHHGPAAHPKKREFPSAGGPRSVASSSSGNVLGLRQVVQRTEREVVARSKLKAPCLANHASPSACLAGTIREPMRFPNAIAGNSTMPRASDAIGRSIENARSVTNPVSTNGSRKVATFPMIVTASANTVK